MRLPDGRLLYNAAGSGDVWVNDERQQRRRVDGVPDHLPAGYSRNLTYVAGTGRVAVLGNPGTSTIVYARRRLRRLARRRTTSWSTGMTGQVIGTGNHTNDANLGNGTCPT